MATNVSNLGSSHPAEAGGGFLRTARTIRARAWSPVDIASLVVFRIAFGLILAWEVLRYFVDHRIERYFIEPKFFFSYYGFEWVKPWSGQGMYWHFGVLGVCAIGIALGCFYRVASALFFLGFTYVFLLDQSLYLNHFYLVCLLSFLLAFLPLHRAFSLDAIWKPTLRSETVPAWVLWLMRSQIGLVYFYGGIAKINGDWLQGEPIRHWLAIRSNAPVVGPFMTQEWLVWIFVFGGLFFDLLVVPALLFRPTRVWAYTIAIVFHLTNHCLFQIGIFPWFMLAASTLFLDPHWPRDLIHRIQRKPRLEPSKLSSTPLPSVFVQQGALLLVSGYLALQIAVPLRHLLYPGQVSWTEEGHRFSWRMKLRDKESEAKFFVNHPATGQVEVIALEEYLNPAQLREMAGRPDMILQFAHHLAKQEYRGKPSVAGSGVEVRAIVKSSLNGRPAQLLIDPSVDLAHQSRSLRHSQWILPLRLPLFQNSIVSDSNSPKQP